jgi:hypothetical protein
MPISITRSLAITLVVTAVAATGVDAGAKHSSRAVVLEWNQLLQNTIAGPGNPGTPRFYAMMHIAMFDAINAIEREFEPYRVRLRPRAGGSPEAAAAQAAHDVLVALNPSAAAEYDTQLAEDLGDHPSGFVRRGAEVGAHVAKEILAWRQNDGWVVSSFPPYSEPPLPGRWQPTPLANAAATFTHLQNAAPMAALSATQFLPPPPPSLTSEQYAADLNEVKLLGKSDSTERTDEQTTVSRLWSAVGTTTGFFSVWNNMARDVVEARYLSLVETARVFVLVNVSIHDALQTTQASKFVYGVWRPVTAIRAADTDLNAATDPDPDWLPLIATPPYPAYARGACAPPGVRHERHRRGRHLEGICGVPRRHAALRRILGSCRGRGDGPHLRRHVNRSGARSPSSCSRTSWPRAAAGTIDDVTHKRRGRRSPTTSPCKCLWLRGHATR